MRSDFQTFNDADMIETQTRAGISASPLLQSQVIGGAITNLNGAQGSNVTISGGGASGWTISASGAGSTLTFTVAVTNAATARAGLGAAAKASPAITGATIPLAKITGGGVDGSITVNAEGIVTAYVAPT